MRGKKNSPAGVTGTTKPPTIELMLSRAEAWAVLRALEIAGHSDRVEGEDKPRIRWAGERLAKLLDPNHFGVPTYS
jgi:hypothetical protein